MIKRLDSWPLFCWCCCYWRTQLRPHEQHFSTQNPMKCLGVKDADFLGKVCIYKGQPVSPMFLIRWRSGVKYRFPVKSQLPTSISPCLFGRGTIKNACPVYWLIPWATQFACDGQDRGWRTLNLTIGLHSARGGADEGDGTLKQRRSLEISHVQVNITYQQIFVILNCDLGLQSHFHIAKLGKV